MSEPFDILDSPEDDPSPEEEDREYRRKAVRLFVYSLGIVAIMSYRLMMVGGLRALRLLGISGLERLFYLGIVGVWSFAGLGAYYGLAALRRQEPRTTWLAISLAGNLLLFGLASWQLLEFFFLG